MYQVRIFGGRSAAGAAGENTTYSHGENRQYDCGCSGSPSRYMYLVDPAQGLQPLIYLREQILVVCVVALSRNASHSDDI